jgi:hypothetical protein
MISHHYVDRNNDFGCKSMWVLRFLTTTWIEMTILRVEEGGIKEFGKAELLYSPPKLKKSHFEGVVATEKPFFVILKSNSLGNFFPYS